MGPVLKIDPAKLTSSGEKCLTRLADLQMQSHREGFSSDWIITSTVTALDAHTSRLLAQLIDLSSVRANVAGNAMYEHLREEMYRSWPNKLDWFKKAMQLPLAGDRPFQEFEVVIDLRNALVHGDGLLTPIQVRSLPKLVLLRKQLAKLLNVDCVGKRVHLSSDTPTRALAIARAFLVRCDEVVLHRYPTIFTFPDSAEE